MVTIEELPDDDLLAIFDFYVVRYQDLDFGDLSDRDTKRKIESWQSLVHVCRRWRDLVLGSPRCLSLRLFCIPESSARNSLEIWPPLPLLIQGNVSESSVDNVIAIFEHSDRICQIDLFSQTERLWTAMQVSFQELVYLCLTFENSSYGPLGVLPDSFLGGSAPRLRYLALTSIPFPGLPKLLLSATHLVHLYLVNIPHSGYMSPEAMTTCLSMLTSLEILQLEFESPQSSPDQENRRSPPLIRFILHALTSLSFKGVNEYLEDLVSRIDAPRLDRMSTTFFNDIDFDTPELNRFINRTPKLRAYDVACLIFRSHEVLVRLQSHPEPSDHGMVEVKILCQVPDWQLSSLAQICTFSLRLVLTMDKLYIYNNVYSPLDWKDDTENTEWLDLLLPFTAVKNLYLSVDFTQRIAPALQELTGERTTEVLPTLQNIFLEGFQPSEPVQEGIAQFISARQLTNHPVAISIWDRDLVRNMSSDNPSLSQVTSLSQATRSKLRLVIGGDTKDNASLHRWVLLKNSITRSQSNNVVGG